MQEEYITRAEFEEYKRQQEQKQTEPISMSDSALLQTLVIMAGTHATDIGLLKGSVNALKTDMEKRLDAIAEVQKLILDRLPPSS